MEAMLRVKDLDICFSQQGRQIQCTDHVSFDVRAGEIVSLVGESGCGKSITALSILGLLSRQGSVTGGQILFEGRDLLKLSEKELDGIRGREIAMIFQDIMYSLNPVFTIGNQLVEGTRRHLRIGRREAARKAVSLLEKVGIREPERVMRCYPHMLSGGMRQRVMIAMALSCHPKLLIADEPTTALDVTIQLQIMELLKRLREELGMAILLITHDLGLVAETADRVAVMYAGQCVEWADARALLEAPAHPYTRALLRAVPDIRLDRRQRLFSIRGSVPEHYQQMRGCRFRERCPYAAQCGGQADKVTLADGHAVCCGRAALKGGGIQ